MTDITPPPPKKSVALSGVPAGNTALCTVGRTGNDLHYRGYDILEMAAACEFEEIAYLLVHERLPTTAELAAYRDKLVSLRALPAELLDVLEAIPKSAHPMDVLRTGVHTSGGGRKFAHVTGIGARDFVGAVSAGATRTIFRPRSWDIALGGQVTGYAVPATLSPFYGSDPWSVQLFVRVRPPAMHRMFDMVMSRSPM